jgi:hypothetical protein
MKAYGGVDVYIPVFLTSTLVGGELSALRLGHFTPPESAPGTHWIGALWGLSAGLDDTEKMLAPSTLENITDQDFSEPVIENFHMADVMQGSISAFN